MEDECIYDALTDSFNLDPFVITSGHDGIGQITSHVACLLFPECVGKPMGDCLKFYAEQPASRVKEAWERVLADHDKEIQA